MGRWTSGELRWRRMAAWDEVRGSVSRSFHEWKIIDGDQRAFLRLGLEFATVEYDRLWKESGEEPYYDGGPEQLDSFEDKVYGLHEQDFAWMLLSGVLRDAVTNFEVYLEKVREEVLGHHGQQIGVPGRSPNWKRLKRFFRQLDVEIESPGVSEVRELRHFLTHRRGELRTEELRKQFQAIHSDVIRPWQVELPKERVGEAMDTLAAAVRAIDSAVYEYSWGRVHLPDLRP
jgi:hypothetical protein